MEHNTGNAAFTTVFNALYERHYAGIYAYFVGRTGNADLALDLLQETFTRAWRHICKLNAMAESQHAYWLFAVAQNLLTDLQRRESRWQAIARDVVSSTQAPIAAPDKQQLLSHELILLEEAIAHLPEQLRTVLAMSVLGDMNSTEIGEALDQPAGTVRYQLSLARKQLIDYLEHE